MPTFEPSKRRLSFPNGSRATLFSADEPNRLRGPQHHWAICDEIAAWQYPEAFDMLLLGLRLGENPRVAIATTPRPVALIKRLLSDRDGRGGARQHLREPGQPRPGVLQTGSPGATRGRGSVGRN